MVPINYGSQQGMVVAVADNLSDAGMLSLSHSLISCLFAYQFLLIYICSKCTG
jgi:hypothetical protein